MYSRCIEVPVRGARLPCFESERGDRGRVAQGRMGRCRWACAGEIYSKRCSCNTGDGHVASSRGDRSRPAGTYTVKCSAIPFVTSSARRQPQFWRPEPNSFQNRLLLGPHTRPRQIDVSAPDFLRPPYRLAPSASHAARRWMIHLYLARTCGLPSHCYLPCFAHRTRPDDPGARPARDSRRRMSHWSAQGSPTGARSVELGERMCTSFSPCWRAPWVAGAQKQARPPDGS